jgi:hypothetical protein
MQAANKSKSLMSPVESFGSISFLLGEMVLIIHVMIASISSDLYFILLE